MGNVTTVIVNNDALVAIEYDKNFGAKLGEAIRTLAANPGTQIPVKAYGLRNSHGSAAIVVESHSADLEKAIYVGGDRSGTEFKKTPAKIRPKAAMKK